MFDMLRIDHSRIIEELVRLQNARVQVFGADGHDFHVNPPLSEDDVAEFERMHRVTLPSDYRQFMTLVGNGGAGPFYGIFPLGKTDNNFGLRVWEEDDCLVGVLSNTFPFDEEWNDISSKPPDELADHDESEYWRQIDAFEKVYWGNSLVNGAIPICHEGCALRIWLVVTGTQAGYLWEDRRSEFEGLKPLRSADGTSATFASWYHEWLNACLAKM
jgi:hypothetical protein